MKSTTRALIVLAVFVLAAIGLLGWSIQHTAAQKAKLEARILRNLSAEDAALILKSQFGEQPGALQEIAANPETRTKILENFKPLLALASEARKTGVADEPMMKSQLDLTELQILGLAYDDKHQKEAGKQAGDPSAQPFSYIAKEEIDAYLARPGAAEEFKKVVETVEASSPTKAKIPTEQVDSIREDWARVSIAAEKAKAEGLDKNRETELQIQFQQARALAQAYAKKHEKEIEVSDPEIDVYIKSHPEFDASSKRIKAEEILKRARAGEDFAKLADENTEDPGNKNQQTGAPNGGLYEKISKGMFQPEFETAALALEPGQIADKLVETPFGYHIIKLESKDTTKGKDGKDADTYNVRHILIGTTYQDPKNPFGRPVPFKDAAKQAAQQSKIKTFIEAVEARNPVTIPTAEEVKIDVSGAPEAPEAMPGMPPGMPQGMPPGMSPGSGTGNGAPPKAAVPNSKITAAPKGKTPGKPGKE